MVSEKIDRVRNKTVTKTNPSYKKGNLKIEIFHVDIHPAREGYLTWKYQDGTSEKITMRGNGTTQFKDSSDNWTDWISDKKDHTDRVVEHTGLTKQYKFEKVYRQPDINTWILETKSGGVESVEISNPVENWGGFIDINLTWTSSEQSPLAKRTAVVKIEEPVEKPVSVECNPKTGPSSGQCPVVKCAQCPPHTKCKYVTEYKESNGRCCPIPCKRIETTKPCPDAGKGWGQCLAEKRPTDTETHRYLAMAPKWVKSDKAPFTCCKVTKYNNVERDRVCCKAMTRECLACQKKLTVDAFCAKPENSTYCPDYKAPAPPQTPAPEPTTIPVSDTDDTTEYEKIIVEKVYAEEEESYSSAVIAGSAIACVLFMIS